MGDTRRLERKPFGIPHLRRSSACAERAFRQLSRFSARFQRKKRFPMSGTKSSIVGKIHGNPSTLALAVLAMTAGATGKPFDPKSMKNVNPKDIENDPRSQKSYALIGAIDPVIAYVGGKRGLDISTEAGQRAVLDIIVAGKINKREMLGIAQIVDTHVRVGNFSRGMESITGDKYVTPLAFRKAVEYKSYEAWANDEQAKARYNMFVNGLEAFMGFVDSPQAQA